MFVITKSGERIKYNLIYFSLIKCTIIKTKRDISTGVSIKKRSLKTIAQNTRGKRFVLNHPYGKIPKIEIPLNIKINQQKEGGVLTRLF